MSEPLDKRLRTGLMAVAAFVRGNVDATSRMFDALNTVDEALARIAELETRENQRDAYIDELKTEVDKLQGRIAELEAEQVKYEGLLREQANAIAAPFLVRIAELEAERDAFRDQSVELTADCYEAEAERDRFKAALIHIRDFPFTSTPSDEARAAISDPSGE